MRNIVVYITCILFLVPYFSSATLNKGDIAVIGFNSDGGSGLNKVFAVVTLVTIPIGESFFITDRGISSGVFNNSTTSEGTLTFSVTTAIPKGTVIMFTVTSGSSPSVIANPSSYSTISFSGWTATIPGNSPWSGNVDQLLIYQGSSSFIFGFNNSGLTTPSANGWSTGNSTNISFSNIPPGLTNATNAIGFVGATHVDNLYYSGTKVGDKATLLAAITNSANWSSNDITEYDLAPGGTSFSGSNPIFGSNTLPVHLISFMGNSTPAGQHLNWIVRDEDNFGYYEVEASTDAQAFKSIGRLNSSGNEQYEFTNTNPGPFHNYYRLKIVDLDGSHTYSKTILLLKSNETITVTVYPNPVSATLHISSKRKIKEIIITDATGRAILHTIVNKNYCALDLQKLHPGLYFAQLFTTEGTMIVTFTKSK